MSADPLLERARAGDAGAFIDLIRALDPPVEGSAVAPVGAVDEEALLRAYVRAYRELPAFGGERSLERWLAGYVEAAGAPGARSPAPGDRFWSRLAAALAAESPALAAPELPERRWPVVPRLQRRRR